MLKHIRKLMTFLLPFVAVAGLSPVTSRAEDMTLPAFNAAIKETSVSGISSGAFMAVQFGTAWSSVIKGVGAIAGGPYGCSGGTASAALSSCMFGLPKVDLPALIASTDRWAAADNIDKTANLAGQMVYLFNGYNDKVVARPVSDTLRDYYAHYLGAGHASALFYQTTIGAGHSQVTKGFGLKCNANGPDMFINDCGYDQAGVILRHVYGALRPRNDGALGGKVVAFRQGAFTGTDKPFDASMDDTGYVFVPAACASGDACRVHIALHGCLQAREKIGESFVLHAGYNEWADTNHIIVLYPQTQSLGMRNPQGCWDWFGYLDSNPTVAPSYLWKSGKQIHAIKAMLDQLTSGAATATAPPATVTPRAPDGLVMNDATDSAIDIVWTAVSGATGYEVFRGDASGQNFGPVGTISGLAFADSGLKPGMAYAYKVRGLFAGGPGPMSTALVTRPTHAKVPPCASPGSCTVR